MMTSEELRTRLKERLVREKQCYICKVTGIDKNTLSAFKTGRLASLYNNQAESLEKYLTQNH